ncbi:LysR substrate-binding domain-containing protein [Mesorhizobium sp. KR9-304]|uniref:LysR substrate-binding domain-containing protein n=1 Tax=Mesorhizobium sp. KR9-304 TaxID=3156614 RepID=UPI0032B36751
MDRLGKVHLNGLRAIETVARCGPLRKAADQLGVSPSAVSQLVNRTEKQIGRAVFERTPMGLVPTEFGRRFSERLTAAFRELSGAMALAEDAADNRLVVSVAPAFAARWLVPRLSRFYATHPEITLRIDASTDIADLDHSDIDIGIRMGDGNWPGVRAELLFAQCMFPVCSPVIAARLKRVEDLAHEWVIREESGMVDWKRWFAQAGATDVTPLQGASFTDPNLCLEATIGGQGVMLASQLLAADALADGRLVAPFGITADSGFGYYVATSAAKKPNRKVTAFKRWLAEEAEKTPQFGAHFR